MAEEHMCADGDSTVTCCPFRTATDAWNDGGNTTFGGGEGPVLSKTTFEEFERVNKFLFDGVMCLRKKEDKTKKKQKAKSKEKQEKNW